MRTPAGTICRYYYEDFHRGRQTQECRLVKASARSLPWAPDLCAKCTVPEILRANGSPDLRLELTVHKRLGLFTQMKVDAYCLKHVCEIEDPHVGCTSCNDELEAGRGRSSRARAGESG